MELIKVDSSNIGRVGYQNGDLLVEYKSGTLYRYKKVPRTIYEEFINAESKGRFMNSNIKNKYDYLREEIKKEA